MTLKRILYIEDEPDIQQIVKLSLESVGGFTVQLASSLAEALLHGRSHPPQLILLDYMLPEIDGAGALRALRNEPMLKETPVVFVTARVQPSEVESYRQMGALGVIPKPFDPMKLPDLVGKLWQSAGAAPPSVRAKLEALRPGFAAELQSKMARLSELQGDLRAFQYAVHAVAGSAGTFGFHAVSRAAGDLETHLKKILDRDGVATAREQERSAALLEALMRVYEQDATGSPK